MFGRIALGFAAALLVATAPALAQRAPAPTDTSDLERRIAALESSIEQSQRTPMNAPATADLERTIAALESSLASLGARFTHALSRVGEVEDAAGSSSEAITTLSSRLDDVESQAGETSTSGIGFTEEGSSLVLEHGGSRIEIGSGGVTLEGSAVSLEAAADLNLAGLKDVNIEGGLSVNVEAAGEANIMGGLSVNVESSGGLLNLKGGPTVKINNGSDPVARLGDTISGTTIVTGSGTVLVP